MLILGCERAQLRTASATLSQEPGDDNDTLQGNVTPEYLFFNWFKTVTEELPAGEHDEIANIIKDEIWPNPLKFYTAEYAEEIQGGVS